MLKILCLFGAAKRVSKSGRMLEIKTIAVKMKWFSFMCGMKNSAIASPIARCVRLNMFWLS